MKIIVHMAIKMQDADSDTLQFAANPGSLISARITECGALEIIDGADFMCSARCGFAPGTWVKWEVVE